MSGNETPRPIADFEDAEKVSSRFPIGRLLMNTGMGLVIGHLCLSELCVLQSVSAQTDGPLASPPAWFQESADVRVGETQTNDGSWSDFIGATNQRHPGSLHVELGHLPRVAQSLDAPNALESRLAAPPVSSQDTFWGKVFAQPAATSVQGVGEGARPIDSGILAPSLSGDYRLDSSAQCDPLGFSSPPTIINPGWEATADATQVYDGKFPVPVQEPWIQWGERFYGTGMTREGGLLFSPTNLTHSKLYVYGDFRLGVGGGRNAIDDFANVASRLNLDIDWAWTSTERFHAFLGPLNRANQFSQVDFTDNDVQLDAIFNPNLVTGFFEGDLGYMLGGLTNTPAEFDLPIAAGLMPLFHQNGIWMDDAVTGIALARNARHSRAFNWSNYDATIFIVFDQLNSPAFGADANAAQALGSAWFIEAYGGYIETGYAYLHDREDLGRSYHNATLAYTRRYFDRIGNSVRVIINSGQDLPEADRTADGGIFLVENNWITATPLTLVPYWNAFYGWGRPQSVARNALAGGILRNVGINFETDGLNGYPTLDDSGINTYGGAVGLNVLGANLDRQLVLEAAMVNGYGLETARITRGDQFGIGARYQQNLSHRTLMRFDAMIGIRRGEEDLQGIRCEYRYKF